MPYQNVRRRTNTEVETTDRTNKRFEEFTETISNVYPKYLGDFHSHPEWGGMVPVYGLSEHDKREFAKSENEDLALIITISSRKKGRMVWEACEDGSIKGSIGKYNLHFNVFGAEIVEGERAAKQLRIITPRSIETLNRLWARK